MIDDADKNFNNKPTVAFFVTCLVDLIRPSVGFSAINVLEAAGCIVEVPTQQSCCGQPGYNSGDMDNSRAVAKSVIDTFGDYDYVIVPSGSCSGMIVHHYPLLFEPGTDWALKAQALANKTFEFTSFLVDVLSYLPTLAPSFSEKKITLHDSCACLREMKVKQQPRQLINATTGNEVIEMDDSDVCCGFGGTFCAKMPDISNKMVGDKLSNALATGADLLVGNDLGCLMNIAGKASRNDSPIEVRHVAEILASDATTPAIAKGELS